MKKEEKSDLRVKNWQEPINWYEPTEERCKYLDIPGIPQRIWVTEEFYKTYKRDFWNEWKEKLLSARCRVKSENGNFWKRCDGDCSTCPHSKTRNTLSLERFFEEENIHLNRDLCIKKRKKLSYDLKMRKKKRNILLKVLKKIINIMSNTIVIFEFFNWFIQIIKFIITYWF